MKTDARYYDEFSLLEAFKSNNEFGLQTIYDMHYHAIWNFANHFMKDHGQTDDIVAESFIKIWQKRTEFDSLKGVAYFLYTITRNACISQLKKKKTKERSLKEIAYLSSRENVEAVDSIRNDLVQLSIIEAQNLPDKMREIFSLLYIEGFSASEVADKLELSTHTVWAQKRNAIKRVRENLVRKGLLSWLF